MHAHDGQAVLMAHTQRRSSHPAIAMVFLPPKNYEELSKPRITGLDVVNTDE
jgi:hypothetical protein